jgi:membrane-associated phospholipid phosphatase
MASLLRYIGVLLFAIGTVLFANAQEIHTTGQAPAEADCTEQAPVPDLPVVPIGLDTSKDPYDFVATPALPATQTHSSSAADQETNSLKLLPRQIVQDQKEISKFPVKLAQGNHWKPTLIAIAATSALVAIDPHDAPYFRKTKDFADFNNAFSSRNTGIAEGLFPAVFYLTGLARKDAYARESGLMSIKALADAEIVSEVIKNTVRRRRPLEIAPDGDFTHTWFRAGPGLLVNRGSFTSGHAIGAFAIAEVFAERYHQHRWVPWAAYGLAGLVAFSRVSNQNHFPSDIFAGAVLGYSVSHFVVLRR